MATIAHDSFMNPFETIKQRLQMQNSPYKSAFDCARTVLAKEGLSAFYRSFSAQLFMGAPYQCIHLVTYETVRKSLNPSETYSPRTHFVAGACAGGLAAAFTTPFDVAKTLLNTQEPMGDNIKVTGFVTAMRTIHSVSGLRGFAKGLTARVAFTAPGPPMSPLMLFLSPPAPPIHCFCIVRTCGHA